MRIFTNDNELGFSPIRQDAHDDVGSFSSMCEEAFIVYYYYGMIRFPTLFK